MMTEEELNQAKDLLDKSCPGPWKFIMGRPKTDRPCSNGRVLTIDPRWDIYTGPEIDPESLKPGQMPYFGIKEGRTQVCHFHPESPLIYESNSNHINNANFILFAKEWIPRAIEEIRRLQGEKNAK